jgi:hypothetical protein
MIGALPLILLNPDSAEGTVVDEGTTTIEVPPGNVVVEANGKEVEEEDEDGEVLDTIDDIKYVKKTYKKDRGGKGPDLAGKAFASPRFPSLSKLINHIDTQLKLQQKHKSQNEKGGITAEEIVLDNFHSMVDNKLRTRVKNEAIEKAEKDKEYLNNAPEILFAPKDAHAWIPGIREPGVANQIKIISAKVQELQKQGMTAANPEMLALLIELAAAAAPKM